MDELITEKARAKINLYLHVRERRSDGYHNLESLVVFVDLADELVIASSSSENAQLQLTIDGSFADATPPNAANLIVKAFLSMRREFSLSTLKNVSIKLTKNIPVAAGLGGGSADAAATLRALARLWKISSSDPKLHTLALALGSDVPLCLASQPAWMRGRGELIEPLHAPFPHCGVVLVNPGTPVSTAEVFQLYRSCSEISPSQGLDKIPACFAELCQALSHTDNDLLPAARILCPAIEPILAVLHHHPLVNFAALSGSGATCFALTATREHAETLAKDVRHTCPQWWVQPTEVRRHF